uniref:rRNA N-glycosylase n=1 Tax=Opuntia streptacantha TaxID=393608 RepID=A0A7C9CVI1_OPUST
MKVALAFVIAMSTWRMLMFSATSSDITKPKSPPPPPPSPFPPPETMRVFDLEESDGNYYCEYIKDLRDKLKDTKRSFFGVPMIRWFPRLQYMYVELKSTAGNSITLAIRMSDLYVDGYSYRYRGRELRARFFDLDATVKDQVKEKLFPDAKNTDKDIKYEGSYVKIQAKAEINRMNLNLGKETLETYIDGISYKDYKSKEFIRFEARLLLIVIQMVPEAVRFKYIQDKVGNGFSKGVTPDSKMIDLELAWDTLSVTIAAATDQNVVANIIGDMGLLKYINPSKFTKWLMLQPDDNVTVWAQ